MIWSPCPVVDLASSTSIVWITLRVLQSINLPLSNAPLDTHINAMLLALHMQALIAAMPVHIDKGKTLQIAQIIPVTLLHTDQLLLVNSSDSWSH